MVALVPLLPAIGKSALAMTKGSAVRMATRSFVSGAAFQAGAELVYQIGEWARSIDADWDSEEQGPVGPNDGCWEVTGTATCWIERRDNPDAKILGYPDNVRKIISVEPGGLIGGTTDQYESVATLELPDGSIVTATAGAWSYDVARWYLESNGDGECVGNAPGGGSLPPQELPPIQDGDCTHNVTFHGFLGNEDGTGKVKPVFLIEPANQGRASGGVITGECNFAPTVVVGGGGDGDEPPTTIPNPPDDPGSDDWWKAIAKGLVQGVAAAVAGKIIDELLSQQAAASFTLTAPCDVDEQGAALTRTWDFPAQNYQQRVLAHQVAGMEILQQHLDWKTPICTDENDPGEGEYRTISFRSDEVSPFGKSRLRKRFRYRSTSGWTTDALVNHWRDFVWESGPVVVKHLGHSWGTPQVWAATAAEGKRVIHHAAREAGLDPNQVGRWEIGSRDSARLGVSGTMRVDTTGGFYWITDRDGSDGRPLVAQVPDPG